MEGQSEDCPFRDRIREVRARQLAAMEGQSEDCPFLPGDLCDFPDLRGRNGGAVGRLPVSSESSSSSKPDRVPQWRGSRKTARFTQAPP